MIFGCGAIGNELAKIIAKMGCCLKSSQGELSLVDYDIVELSNLSR